MVLVLLHDIHNSSIQETGSSVRDLYTTVYLKQNGQQQQR